MLKKQLKFKMVKTYFVIISFLLGANILGCKNSVAQAEDEGEEVADSSLVRSLSDVNTLAETLKNEILNSPTEISVSGTSYYVSNNGNDSNDGKSQDRAWATLGKVSWREYNNGDAVFFERGGIWRGKLTAQPGVSYSAYGNGSKPKIYGSPQNYSVREKWKETETPNVYVYDEALENDAGLLVFNEGQVHSVKKIIGVDGFSGNIGELQNDLEMFHNSNDQKVYLCSTGGNPADRYSSIEFCLKNNLVSPKGDNILIDNLCLKYGGAHGVGSGTANGLRVTNCEIGWIGGSILHGTARFGNGVEIWGGCSDYAVQHCYIYQIYDAGITHQWKNSSSSDPVTMTNVTYSNNLLEYCTYSIEYFLGETQSENDLMKNILFTDNICRFAGYGWGEQRPNKIAMHIQGWQHWNPAENFIIRNNIFDRSRNKLISIGAKAEASLPLMQNNVYIQYRDGEFGAYGVNQNQHKLMFTPNIRELLIEKGIEENPTIVFTE